MTGMKQFFKAWARSITESLRGAEEKAYFRGYEEGMRDAHHVPPTVRPPTYIETYVISFATDEMLVMTGTVGDVLREATRLHNERLGPVTVRDAQDLLHFDSTDGDTRWLREGLDVPRKR